MSNELRIGLVIADLEMRFSTTFKTCSNDYYGIAFDNSDVSANIDKLNTLLNLVKSGCNYKGHMRHKITTEDVTTILQRFTRVFDRYNDLYGPVPRNMKLYTLFNLIRQAEEPNPEQIARQALESILKRKTPTIKPSKVELAEKLSMERQLQRIKKGRK